MRLTREYVETREKFIREAVRANPKVTGEQLQELLYQHFGKKMRLMRMFAVKKQALKELKEKHEQT